MTGVIAVLPTHQFSQNGEALSAGTILTYAAGTVTPAVTWQDKAQTTANTNPIVLDAQGRCDIWLQPGNYYDFVIKDSLGNTIDTIENIGGAVDTAPAVDEWVITGLTPTFISATSFSLTGDQTTKYQRRRRIKATISGGAVVYGTIISSVFSTVTTVTLVMDSTGLDSGLSIVDIGVISYNNSSITEGTLLNLTGYAGSDVQLGIGQIAVYDVSAITTLALRIATGDNQEYSLRIRPTLLAGASISVANLQPNNTNTGAGAIQRNGFQSANAASITPFSLNENIFNLCVGATVQRITAEICTRTNLKSIESRFRNIDTTTHYTGMIQSYWTDTTTPWSSLGTLNFGAALTGRIMVKREM